MGGQTFLTSSMRAILVDWLVEVQENFELNHETLYLAVKLVDMYVSRVVTAKESLQLVGAVSLFIAAKFDVSKAEVILESICSEQSFKSLLIFLLLTFYGMVKIVEKRFTDLRMSNASNQSYIRVD